MYLFFSREIAVRSEHPSVSRQVRSARTVQAVADKYKVSKRAVTNLAAREDWRSYYGGRLAEGKVLTANAPEGKGVKLAKTNGNGVSGKG